MAYVPKQKLCVSKSGGVINIDKKPAGVMVEILDLDVKDENHPYACHCTKGDRRIHAHWFV